MNTLSMEQKAKKAAYNKAYAAKKKAEISQPKFDDFLSELKFEKAFDHKVRLYKNLKMELENSYCATPGSVLNFTQIKNENNLITFRVLRTGRRTFYTTSNELVKPE
jgi:glucose-6-phosphate 1-dehydrogenase